MTKRGRPGLSYEQFQETWEQLLGEGRAGTNVAHDLLGGAKSTIMAFRERFEREETAKKISILKSIKLTEAVKNAIAEIKVSELETLEQAHKKLELRVEGYISNIKEVEFKLSETLAELESTKTIHATEKLEFEKQIAASHARNEDLEKREQKLSARCDQLSEQYNQAKQEAAVAKKEIEMLREQSKKKTEVK